MRGFPSDMMLEEVTRRLREISAAMHGVGVASPSQAQPHSPVSSQAAASQAMAESAPAPVQISATQGGAPSSARYAPSGTLQSAVIPASSAQVDVGTFTPITEDTAGATIVRKAVAQFSQPFKARDVVKLATQLGWTTSTKPGNLAQLMATMLDRLVTHKKYPVLKKLGSGFYEYTGPPVPLDLPLTKGCFGPEVWPVPEIPPSSEHRAPALPPSSGREQPLQSGTHTRRAPVAEAPRVGRVERPAPSNRNNAKPAPPSASRKKPASSKGKPAASVRRRG